MACSVRRAQGVMEETREGAVIRTMRADSELPNVVGEVAFFLGIPQPRSWQVCTLTYPNLPYLNPEVQTFGPVDCAPEQHHISVPHSTQALLTAGMCVRHHQ